MFIESEISYLIKVTKESKQELVILNTVSPETGNVPMVLNQRVYFNTNPYCDRKHITGIEIPRLFFGNYRSLSATFNLIRNFMMTFIDITGHRVIENIPAISFWNSATSAGNRGKTKRTDFVLDLSKSYMTYTGGGIVFIGTDVMPFVFHFDN